MANAAKLAQKAPVRAMLVGYPGAGKTGALSPLVSAGYKIRMLDFDGNYEPLLKFSDPAMLGNVDIVHFEDKMRMGAKGFEPVGQPTAFKRALDMMDRWKYTDADGTEVDLGASKDWGCDTIVVLDSLTTMGEAAMARVRSMLNKTMLNTTQQVWGIAQGEQDEFIKKLTSKANNFHVVVLAHLKLVGPKEITAGDDDLTKELKAKAADVTPTRLFPSALGKALPPLIGGHFPTLLLVEPEYLAGNRAVRKIKSMPRPDLDLKAPIPELPATLDLSDGMKKIFDILAPPLAECVNTGASVPGTSA